MNAMCAMAGCLFMLLLWHMFDIFSGPELLSRAVYTEDPTDVPKNEAIAHHPPITHPPITHHRRQLCKSSRQELLWSCNERSSRNPTGPSTHVEAEAVLRSAVVEMCKAHPDQLETYLVCDFLPQYSTWTDDASEWLDEAYMTYIGFKQGAKGPNKYELAMFNLIRSVHMFSTRPIVLVIIGSYDPPASWRAFPNLIIYRMNPLFKGLGFNFNKDRSMIGSRIIKGIALDSDQLVTHTRLDDYFKASSQEITKEYPFPIAPVHFLSREPDTKAYPFPEEGFPSVRRTMRWCHAHPTWTYWSVPFIHDILLIRMGAEEGKPVSVWKIFKEPGYLGRKGSDMMQLLQLGQFGRVQLKFEIEKWMSSDEPSLNACLWLVGATKTWCKMDLEPKLFLQQDNIHSPHKPDPKWFPDGIPILFYSAHNTKNGTKGAILLDLIEKCRHINLFKKVPCTAERIPECDIGEEREQRLRLSHPDKYLDIMCCCLHPRFETPIFWHGWYENASLLPAAGTGCLAI